MKKGHGSVKGGINTEIDPGSNLLPLNPGPRLRIFWGSRNVLRMDAHTTERNTSPFDLPAKTFLRAWLSICAVVCLIFFLAFVFNQDVIEAGQWVWSVLTYLASPLFSPGGHYIS
jgi:hypothetical protein